MHDITQTLKLIYVLPISNIELYIVNKVKLLVQLTTEALARWPDSRDMYLNSLKTQGVKQEISRDHNYKRKRCPSPHIAVNQLMIWRFQNKTFLLK